MSAERWARVKQITADVLERPESERPAWLAHACAGDETLRREVDSLLTAHDRAGNFLEIPGIAAGGAAEAVAAAASQGGTQIAVGRAVGPYRILRELGSGGMGVVYLAERSDAAFEKQVAIKVVRGGFAGGLLDRLSEERRILATLDHPNIARLLDGGATEDGLPYLVMEYVDGIPLDVYCETRALPLAQRLLLFQEVCAAVQYAHQRLVIHRDLKARNILVTADGTAKLLDFGIARLLEPGVAPEDQTRTALRAFTLEGASPEQVRGEPMTVTSDVYALGVLLFRLLSGQSPYGPQRRGDTDLARAICEEVPPWPSAVAPAGEGRLVRGELDWIALTALRKEPGRRYASVERLADDVGRHLGGRPVAAAPDSWRYRARKFTLRNRTAVGLGALLAVSLGAGVVATLWQARRAEEQRRIAEAHRQSAERRFNDVRKLANSFLFEFHDAIKDLPGSTAARALVVKRAAEYLDDLGREAHDDVALQGELAAAYQRIGDVQGAWTYANLGDTTGARVSYEKALDLQQAIVAADPSNREARRDLAATHEKLGRLFEVMGEPARAGRAYETVLSTLAVPPGGAAPDVRTRALAARAHSDLAWLIAAGPEPRRALDHARQALAVAEELLALDPGDRRAQERMAIGIERMGTVLERSTPNTGAGLASFGKAYALWVRMLETEPINTSLQRSLMANRSLAAEALQASGDVRGSLAVYRDALRIAEVLGGADAANVAYRSDLASLLAVTGEIESQTGEPANALRHLQRALALLDPIAAADPANDENRVRLTMVYGDLGELHARRGRTARLPSAERVDHWRKARSYFRKADDSAHAIRSRDGFDAEARTLLQGFSEKVRECDAALAKLIPPE